MTDITAEDLVATLRGNNTNGEIQAAIDDITETNCHPVLRNPVDLGYEAHPNSFNTRLQRMRTKHCTVANMHCVGLSNIMIAQLTGTRAGWVSYVLREPIVKKYMQEHILINMEAASEKSKGMLLRAVETVSDIMQSGETRHKLTAAKIAIEMNQKAGPKEDETAEDVIRRALEVVRADGSRITMTEERKRTFHASKD